MPTFISGKLNVMKKIFVYFVQGIVITVPVVITGYVVYKLFTMISSLFDTFGTIVSPVVDPIIILLLGFGVIFLMGLLGSSIVLRPLFSVLDDALEHTPFVKTIYTSIKDLISAFVGSKKRFNKPVLVQINKENNIHQLGFITKDDLEHINIGEGKVAVYVPLSYSFSGNLLIVSADQVTKVNASSTEVMKFIVSGGVTEID